MPAPAHLETLPELVENRKGQRAGERYGGRRNMSGPLNQFSVYRLRRDTKETRTRRHQSYAYLQQYGLQVRSDYYDQLYLSEFDPETTEMELRRWLEKDLPADASGDTLAVGDVLAITREGIQNILC